MSPKSTSRFPCHPKGRYPWNMSRFRFICRACSVRIGGELRTKRKAERNTQSRARRAQLKHNAKIARAYGSGPASADAYSAEREVQKATRKVRLAWFKRQSNRLRGPYRDPIKLIISAYRKRAARSTAPFKTASLDESYFESAELDHNSALRRIRDKHSKESELIAKPPLPPNERRA